MSEDKYEQHVSNMLAAIPEHERQHLPEREEGEGAKQYLRRLRKLTYNNARQAKTWQELQKLK